MFNIMTKEDFDSSEIKVNACLQIIKDKNVKEATLCIDETPSTNPYYGKTKIIFTGKIPDRDYSGLTTYPQRIHRKGFEAGLSILSTFYRSSFDVFQKSMFTSIAIELSDAPFPLDISFRTSLNEFYELQEEYPDIDIIFVVNDFAALKEKYELDSHIDAQIEMTWGTDILIPIVCESTFPLNGIDQADENGVYKSVCDLYGSPSAIVREKLPDNVELQILAAGKPFSAYLKALLKSKQLTRSTICHRGNFSKQYISKLMNDEIKKPSKKNLLCLAVAFQLNLKETVELLNFMGYTFSNNSVIDILLKYYIYSEQYDIHNINGEIFARTGKCLIGDK